MKNAEETNDASTVGVVVSPANAATMMKTLLDRGYLTSLIDGKKEESSVSGAATEEIIVPRHGGTLFSTFHVLLNDCAELLESEYSWWMPQTQVASELGISLGMLQNQIFPHCHDLLLTPRSVMARFHMRRHIQQFIREFQSGLPVSVSTLAKEMQLPPEQFESMLVEELNETSTSDEGSFPRILRRDDGSKVLVNSLYWNQLRDEVVQLLQTTTEPVVVDDRLCRDNNKQWTLCWVVDLIQAHAQHLGEWHPGSSTFVPHCYIEQQKARVQSTFASQGYVAVYDDDDDERSQKGHILLSIARMKEWILDDDTTDTAMIIALPNSIVHCATFVDPLVDAIGECLREASWLNLQSFFPVCLLDRHPEDVQLLIEQRLSHQQDQIDLFLQQSIALLFSTQFWRRFRDITLTDAIHDFARTQVDALMLTEETAASAPRESKTVTLSAKERHKARQTKVMQEESGDDTSHYAVLPLHTIVQVLLDSHPALTTVTEDLFVWEQLCSEKVHDDHADILRQRCNEAIQKELNRQKRKKKLTTVISAREDSDFDSIQAAFEDTQCFVHWCYLLQAQSKLLSHLRTTIINRNGNEDGTGSFVTELEQEFLYGSCREFVGRMTAYAMFRNSSSDEAFTFGTGSTVPFYHPVDLLESKGGCVGNIVLKSSSPGDPLAALKTALPTGSMLADMWTTCVDEEDTTSTEELFARITRFIGLAREYSLSIVGIPFKVLDKKSEKKFLAFRKQKLTEAIQRAETLGATIDLSLMLLYQQAKSMVVLKPSSPSTRHNILRLLVNERKVSQDKVNLVARACETLEGGQGEYQELYADQLREKLLA